MALAIVPHEGEHIRVQGTVLYVPQGTLLTSPDGSWLVDTKLPHGTHAIMTGFACGQRLFSESEEVLEYDVKMIKDNLDAFILSL